MGYAIKAEDITCSFGKNVALHNVRFQIESGGIHALIGPEKSGKTTLLSVIAGLNRQFSGKLDFSQTDFLGSTGFVIESPVAIETMTAYKNLNALRIAREIGDKERLAEVLERAGLTGDSELNTLMYKCSSGLRQRYGIAAALLHRPELLILDEPLSGFAADGLVRMQDTLRALRDSGLTLFITSTSLDNVYTLADSFLFISDGRIIAAASGRDVQASCRQSFTITVPDAGRAAEVAARITPRDGIEVISTDTLVINSPVLSKDALSAHFGRNGIIVNGIVKQHQSLDEYFGALLSDHERRQRGDG